MNRREYLKTLAAMTLLGQGCATLPPRTGAARRMFFTSAGKTFVVYDDGTGLRPLAVEAPGQATWQPCGFYPDGKVLMLSMEPRRDGPGRPFEIYYRQTPTHLWVHDLDTGMLREIVTRERRAVFYTPALLLNDGRLLVQVVTEEGGQILNVAEDGTDAREFTRIGEGLPYGFSLSPDGSRVAFHLASPQGYQIYTSDTLGADRVLVAANPERLYFAPAWSPDGQWLLFQACDYQNDPGHDWADLCIARPDGTGLQAITEGQPAWFAATYGNTQSKGGGSNVPVWTHQNKVLYPRRTPGARVAWEYQANRPDVDHFNRDFKPEQARGGTEICRLDPWTGKAEVLAPVDPVHWDFRISESPDGARLAFCRCATGTAPSLWVADSDGKSARKIADGIDGQGADHPRWVPVA